jgi:CheY-like chemotaxis protein/HPt (histidine-containing phosphotransfer) domain-containing protein
VRDTGVGIKKEDFGKIFAAYCHLNYSSKSFSKNTGLGLAISKRLVEAMNGVIGVESEVGAGSVFWFKLPLPAHEDMDTDRFDIRKSIPENAKILVVAQGEAFGTSVQVSLHEQFGVEVDLVHTIDKARQFIEKSFVDINPYSLFLIDYSVKGDCGVKFAQEIRQHTAFDNSYIVLMIPISESLQTGVASGIEKLTCINKPLLPGKIRSLIPGLLAKDKNHKVEINALSEYKIALSSLKRCCLNGAKSPHILVVDDNPINREVLTEMLSELNYAADAVADGHSAINAMLDENYDLILLDCRLPDSDGYDVAAKIRRMKENGKQPIIIVTSSDNSLHNQQLCFESGVDDFLNKPVTLSELSNAIFSWLPEGREEGLVDTESNRATVINMFSAPVLDMNIIEKLKSKDKDNPEFFQKIIDIFINDTFDRIDALKNLLEQGDYGGIERMAHSIQSGCIHIGAKRMARYCDVLRNMARNQVYAETSRALQYFIEEFDRVLLDLNTELHATSETH